MKTEMTQEEISDYYCKKFDTNLGCVLLSDNAIAVCDPRCNDLSKPGFALIYSVADHTIEYAKIDKIFTLIVDDVLGIIKDDGINDVKTFIDFIGSIDKYCKEYDCDYRTALLNKNMLQQNREDNIVCMKSPISPNQEIIYDKTNKQIKFLENHESKTIVYATLDYIMNGGFLINEDNFAEFAKESFEFCEENGCSFKDYATNIVFDIMDLKYNISECEKNILKKSYFIQLLIKIAKQLLHIATTILLLPSKLLIIEFIVLE